MRTSICSTLLAVLAISATPSAQQRPAPPPAPVQPGVTFKAEVNYVEIDAIVTDAQGNVVRDLTKDDFQVIEDGKPQSLSVFATVDVPIERADPPLFARSVIPPDVVSNRTPFEGRVFVIVMDSLHTGFTLTGRARQAAHQFVEKYVGANDLVAVVSTGAGKGTSQDFTSDHDRILKAIDRLMGQKADSAADAASNDLMMGSSDVTLNRQANDLERGNKAQNALATLRNAADFLADMRGRRKAVVLFSEGIDYDISNPFQNQYASQIRDKMQELIAAATRANVSIYGVDPRGLTVFGDGGGAEQSFSGPDYLVGNGARQDALRRGQDSLRTLSDETGGFAVVNANDFTNAFSRILQDNSSYYVLGYYPANDKRDGRFRSIQVRLSRPGLTVRARKGYVAPRGKAESPKVAPGEHTSIELREAMASPAAISGLPITAFVAPFRGTAPNDAVVLSIEVDGAKMKFASKDGLFSDDLEISLFAADATGRIKDGGRDELNLALKPQTYQMVQNGAFRVMHRLQVPPGHYQLHIGAREKNGGQVGTVVYDLDTPDFSKGPLAISGIAITSAFAGRTPTANVDPMFKDVLPSSPAAIREFPRGDQLALFVEVYDNALSAPHRVAITATVLTDDGQSVFSTSDERNSDELKGASGGGYGYVAKVPLNERVPGRYVLRVEAKSLAGNAPPVAREVEFRVK